MCRIISPKAAFPPDTCTILVLISRLREGVGGRLSNEVDFRFSMDRGAARMQNKAWLSLRTGRLNGMVVKPYATPLPLRVSVHKISSCPIPTFGFFLVPY